MMKKIIKKILTLEVLAFIVIVFGAIIFIFFGIKMFYYFGIADSRKTLNVDVTDAVGSFIGGVVAPLWTLASVLLFYSALRLQNQQLEKQTEQIQQQEKQINIQTDALTSQNDALEVQRQELIATREELTLQRQELAATREVFQLQKFENTFFNMLSLNNELKNKIKYREHYGDNKIRVSLDFFKFAKNDINNIRTILYKVKQASQINDSLRANINEIVNRLQSYYSWGVVVSREQNSREIFKVEELIEIEKLIKNKSEKELVEYTYLTFLSTIKKNFEYYYRNLLHILKFIQKNEREELRQSEEERVTEIKTKYKYYVDLIQSQLNSDELFVLFYDGLYDTEMYDLLKYYKFFEGIDIEGISQEYKEFYS